MSNAGFRVRARNPIFHDCVEPAFRRALWNRQDARLKAGAMQTKAEFSHRHFGLWGLILQRPKGHRLKPMLLKANADIRCHCNQKIVN